MGAFFGMLPILVVRRANHMADEREVMITVDGVEIKCPSTFSYGLQDISSPDAGRTQDTIMHKEMVGQKVKLELGWKGLTWKETSDIMKAFNPEYIMVRYPDMLTGEYETKKFYSGDKDAPVKMWLDDDGHKIIETLSFNIIEV
jgi:hypothetical protein